ncbi:hypothetical protein [Terasakiella pusilla]|uniref:hypothetical protein n=1 Tax=Terasakiella pusilla TaxID=64973 RepID=UPI00048BAFDB|nr:hypothetical protein [Terasakiella pusilla]
MITYEQQIDTAQPQTRAHKILGALNGVVETTKEMTALVRRAIHAKNAADNFSKGSHDKVMKILLED